MREDLDDRVQDVVALNEIELYADVLSAVAAADGPLTAEEIDAVLGVGTMTTRRAAMPVPRESD